MLTRGPSVPWLTPRPHALRWRLTPPLELRLFMFCVLDVVHVHVLSCVVHVHVLHAASCLLVGCMNVPAGWVGGAVRS